MADELNNDARELMSAASNPHTTTPVIPAGSNWATIEAKTESLEATCKSHFWLSAKAIIPGMRNIKTGNSLKYPARIDPRRACFMSLPDSTL